MRYFLLILAVVAGQSVLAAAKKPLIADPIVEKAVRKELDKPKGILTKADLEEVRSLDLGFTKLGSGFTKITDASLKEVAEIGRAIAENNS